MRGIVSEEGVRLIKLLQGHSVTGVDTETHNQGVSFGRGDITVNGFTFGIKSETSLRSPDFRSWTFQDADTLSYGGVIFTLVTKLGRSARVDIVKELTSGTVRALLKPMRRSDLSTNKSAIYWNDIKAI